MAPAQNPAPKPAGAGEGLDVMVVGAGIAGLTAAALLARAGLAVELLEAHSQSGGCAGTFQRGPYTFDVGATQVAGLEGGGIHTRLFQHLGVPAPAASPLDPGCVVDLDDGRPAVRIWRDPRRWRQECRDQFPGSERFWQLCALLHQASWDFAGREPVLPARSPSDWRLLLAALGPASLVSGLAVAASVADLQRLSGAGSGPGGARLRRFLDLQLRLYSQEPADRTAALYGATVLQMVQEPLGLWHLQGSMQSLSDSLEQALALHGGRLRLGQRLQRLQAPLRRGDPWRLEIALAGGGSRWQEAQEVVLTLPPQSLEALLGDQLPAGYRQRLAGLNEPSGALVFYGACERSRLPEACPPHLQLAWSDPGSLFVSVSREGDGRAPAGQATVIASVFTPARPWFEGEPSAYRQRKQAALTAIQSGLQRLLGVEAGQWCHGELATPRGWARWTGRPWGYVGGLGQHPRRFGPFGLASRTPLQGLWLCGDAIHPGEGTAGVSQSALMVCRQLLVDRGRSLKLPG
ncbi:MAG: C-3',4' desaturase CrtD [Synechococcaceae cyanobacterium]|nr:C-3',4' desaturase CrtD [Synechococcaceae cyanobacterium]